MSPRGPILCRQPIRKLGFHSVRSHRPISAIFIEIPYIDDKYTSEEKRRILEGIGDYLNSTIRLSDVACRYGDSSFLILMPNSSEEDKVPIDRINEGLIQYIRRFIPDFEIIASSSIRNFEEDCKEFMERATKL